MRFGKRQYFSLLIIGLLFFGTSSSAWAANKSFIKQVKEEYQNFETKTAANYSSYQKAETKKYEDYNQKESKSFELFANQTKTDASNLEALLKSDLESLEKRFGGNEYASKLRDYKNKINPYFAGSPMHQYSVSINPNYALSLMMQYKNTINQHYAGSPMMQYRTAVNENYAGSPMMKYKNMVNPHYAGSSMSKLKNESNEYYANSILYKYSKGIISQKEASKQWKALLQKESQAIQNTINQSKESINQVESTTLNAILKQKYNSVNGILKQREKTLAAINELRKQYFGETISFESLIPNLGEVNVILNGEWLAFSQPPAILNGTTLVPMRAIFEKLEAEVKWHPQTQSVTANKQNILISLTIDKKTASINGKEVALLFPPKLINGHTMVPLRFVSEAFGAEVKWDAKSETVTIQVP